MHRGAGNKRETDVVVEADAVEGDAINLQPTWQTWDMGRLSIHFTLGASTGPQS